MKIPSKGEEYRVNLQPGDYYATDRKVLMTTLLGSCVSACLYDPVNKVVGMNHFLLTHHPRNNSGSLIVSNPGRYGVHAMELMMNKMFQLGAVKRHLKAKAFGGANLYNHYPKQKTTELVGDANARFLIEFLEMERIPLVSFDLTGTKGRVIYFSAVDYSVFVRTIQHTDVNGLVSKETEFLESQRRFQKGQSSKIDLWHP